MVSLSDIKERAKDAVSRDGDSRIDQGEARVERARQEAREEARREAQRQEVQERVAQAREEGREAGEQAANDRGTLQRVTEAISAATEQVGDNDGQIIDDIDAAMGTDFDGDGEPFGAELGFQTNDRGQAENQAFGTLGERVTTNEQNITSLESEVFGGTSQRQTSDADRMSPGGVGVGFGSVAGDEAEMLEQMGFDPDNEGGL
jgi:DNA anti-recombination protein RmuC